MHPHIPILLTFFSPSGYEVRKNYPLADRVCYIPVDLPGQVEAFLDAHQPLIAVFVKYEIWHTLLGSLHKRGVPTYLISARFRPGQLYFRPWGGYFLNTLRRLSHIFVQDESSYHLLLSNGIKSTTAGDTRFDRVAHIAHAGETLSMLEPLAAGRKVVVAGSTWPQDEEVLSAAFAKWSHGTPPLLIIAPHEVHTERIAALAGKWKGALLWSQLHARKEVEAGVLIIDTIGLLSKVYRYADVCYIGGGFGAGIHNTLEAAAWGKPVLFGPRYKKFAEAIALIEVGAARAIHSEKDLYGALETYLLRPESATTAGLAAASLVQRNQGATALIMETLARAVSGEPQDS